MTLLTLGARAFSGLSLTLLLTCAAAAATPAAAPAGAADAPATTPRESATPERPRICVALSGGGARGYAHVGVLKQLEMMRIPVDCIAGTSMGAVVGGVYASGLDAWQLEERIKGLNLNHVALDRVERRALPQAEREDDTLYPVSGLGFGNGSLRLPTGALQANRLVELLQNWTSRLPPGLHFDQLSIPFRAVATDLENGEQVVFDRGPLHLAMRASMAAPAVFAPIEIGGRLLTDGGLVQNLPVEVARSLDADVVIAVNITTPLASREALGSFVEISQQMVGILTEQNVRTQKQKLRPGIDVLIEPDLKELSFLDFGRAAEAIAIGERTTRAMESQLSHLALSVETWRDHQARRNRPVLPDVRVDFVEVDASENIPAAFIRRRLELGTGGSYDSEAINTRIDALLASRQFESITHELVERDGAYGVRVNARERAWGPHFFRFGLSLSSGFEGLSGFRLQLGHRRPWLTEAGLEWRNDIEVGNSQSLWSELRQPMFSQEGAFIAGYAGYRTEPQNVFRGKNRIAEYGVTTARVGVDLGIPLGDGGTLGITRIGLQGSRISARPALGNPDASDGNGFLPRAMYRQFGLRARITLDQLDEPTFPRHGYLADFEALSSFSRDRTNYQSAQLQTIFAHSAGNHSLNLGVRLGSRWESGANPGADGSSLGGFTLGGFQQLSAYQPNQFNGNALAYANLTYLLRAVRFDLLDQSVFVGTSLEIGSAWDRQSGWTAADLRRSASLFLGFSSVIGPIHLGVALAPGGVRNFFFQLGRP